jgi:hypothetical protein
MCQVARRCRCARDCYAIEAMRPLADFFQTCLSEIGENTLFAGDYST